MQLVIDSSGTAGRIDVLSEDGHLTSTDHIEMVFPPALGTGTIQRFALSPLLFVMLHRYILSRDVELRRRAEPSDQPMITFSFRNLVRPSTPPATPMRPAVQVSSSDLDLAVSFPAGTPIYTIIVGINVTLLRQLLGHQVQKPLVQALLSGRQSYLYEEMGSLAVQQIAADLLARPETDPLFAFYVTVKGQELVYQFMSELLQRDTKAVYSLREDEGKRLFMVRDELTRDLRQAPSIPQLASVAGMSESKLRRLFRQVFGLSLYAYYQTVRMQEAARLLREAKLSVSETGYRLGFENLSHFTRVFLKYLGQKPKQYAKLG
ncbi:helix-turn-helix transcriptional regulator [Spirosoma sp. KCTC 42546]|uniref:helix-turn-helix transcriptional regulator n=1 Tax=Spirosoma sp. KCTC 42546 TaxID=2520506 RepID=UPI0011575BEC|nr:helix-turn-helix transcriptional regulator [Spirosoma sp. KCTC 42546]QDK82347.1 helix-turn-helix transcriptional regulator [Spirosoma sp. KCTC 42546]